MIENMSNGTGTAKDNLNSQEVFFHEYTHHLQLQDWSGAMPTWVSEGFAEFFATAEIDKDGNVTIGKFPAYRSWEVFLGSDLSAEELVSADYEKLAFYESYALYGRSWLLTHYLTVAKARKGQLNRYLEGIDKGMSPRDSAKAAFGDLKALQRELEDYIKPRSFLAFTVDARLIPVGQVAVRQLSPAEAAVMPVRIRTKAGVDRNSAPRVADQARGIGATYPNDPIVQSALAEAEFDAKNYAAAEAAADRALAANPNSVQALIYKGHAELELGRAKAKTTDWDAVRAWFTRANKLDTENAEPLELYYDSYAAAGQQPTANALDGLLYAVDLAPRDFDLRMYAVRALVTGNRIKDAKDLFAPIAYQPHFDKDMREAIGKIMTALTAADGKSAVALIDSAVALEKKKSKA
jgi:tetratricopeptide (TPR) repeat protein